ncbi:MAG TPA: ZIP family metal transporter [Acidimicrobiia bacterium]|nr:ZIP family metal transporter [Acidimicrobiia bacterium]
MGAALGWGTLAASSLVLGALLGIARVWPNRLVGLVLAFGAGALIAAVSFELAEEGAQIAGGRPVAAGLALGALSYFACDFELDRMTARMETSGRGSVRVDAGPALALGAVLDGIPEQLVLGIGLATGGEVGVGLLVAIFVSNLPEAIGSASELRRAGRSDRDVLLLWVAVAAACALATVAGYAVADVASPGWQGGINGYAAGALLVMLVDTMIPDAAGKAGRVAGVVTALGFAVAAGLSGLST